MRSVIIAGGTGLIGSKLDQILSSNGFEVRILTRTPAKYTGSKYYRWNVDEDYIDRSIFPADIVINLAGEGIADKRWTKKRKDILISSRVNTNRFLLRKVREHQGFLAHFIGASAIGYYGDRKGELLAENSVSGSDFLADCTRLWEESSLEWKKISKLVSLFRIGIVLSKTGGALSKMRLPFKFGLASYFGHGRQYYSWIHIEDLVAMLRFSVDQALDGIYNAVSPQPVKNIEFIKTLRDHSKGVQVLFPVPGTVLRWTMGEMSSTVLNSSRVSSNKIQEMGFTFHFPSLDMAFSNLLN